MLRSGLNFLFRDGTGRVYRESPLEFGQRRLQIALAPQLLTLADMELRSLESHLVGLDAIISVEGVGSEGFLVVLESGVIVMQGLSPASLGVVRITPRAASEQQASADAKYYAYPAAHGLPVAPARQFPKSLTPG